jgi:murein DD-endopeptidase MepM/ murein hydrolase activator NlpD
MAERDARIRELEQDRNELAARLAARPSIMPSSGYLSSLFGTRHHPVLGVTRDHRGVDIAAPTGRPILAPAEGTVRFAGNKEGGFGYTVEIDHGYGYLTRFAHASRLLVNPGERVQRGQVIALVGATGRTTGPHLHYEVEVHGRRVDPVPFMAAELIRK